MLASHAFVLHKQLQQLGCKRALSQLATSAPSRPQQQHHQQQHQPSHPKQQQASRPVPPFLQQQQKQQATTVPPPSLNRGAPPQPPHATSTAAVASAASAPPPAASPLKDEEEVVLNYAKKRLERVSLRSLAEVGLGTRPWLSSMRDAVPMRDPLSSLNSRLSHASDAHSPAEKGLLRMATFLHRELPIRFARGITFIDKLNLCRLAPSLNVVRDCYLQSFRDIVSSPCPTTAANEASFVKVLEQVGERHADELLLVARGVYELRSQLGMDVLESGGSFEALHAQLDELHLKRIALRILMGHYLALHRPARPDYVGIICTKTRLQDVIEVAAADARWICKQRFNGRAPRVEVIGGENMVMACIPESLYYLTMELIKNSLRAVAERHNSALLRPNAAEDGTSVKEGKPGVPPIQAILSREYSLTDGQQVVIEIRDEGGGIPPKDLDKVFCYLFSTSADAEVQQSIMGGRGAASSSGGVNSSSSKGGEGGKKVPLAGLGYGLGIAKSYALYFGGDLRIENRPGEGCSVFVTLSRLGECKEPMV